MVSGAPWGISMRFRVTLEPAEEGGFVAQCVEIPGAVSEGETQQEALENVASAIHDILEVRRQRAEANAAAAGVDLVTVEVDA